MTHTKETWLDLAKAFEAFGDTTTAAYIRIYVAAADAGITNIEEYLK